MVDGGLSMPHTISTAVLLLLVPPPRPVFVKRGRAPHSGYTIAKELSLPLQRLVAPPGAVWLWLFLCVERGLGCACFSLLSHFRS